MSMNDHFDIAIVGGGIIGASTAMALSDTKGVSLVLIEAEDALASHQTGNNSGVIHSGLYYKPGSLKAKNCTRGRELLFRFCEEHDIPHDRCGKVVVATQESELPALEVLYQRGIENGLSGLKKIGPEEILEREPHISGIEGLHVPQTGIVDFPAATRKYVELMQERGGQLKLSTRLLGVTREVGGLVLETDKGEIRAKNLVNCGGLHCDRIARLTGDQPPMKVVPFRGEYYELVKDRHFLVNNLVYPVPDPRFPFLGVHFTRMIHGGIEAGPNAVLAAKREGYNRFSFNFSDVFSYYFYGGFWKMAFKYWRPGLGEIWRSMNKRAFVNALRRLMPELEMSDVHRGGAGVRAQALGPNGKFLDDFFFLESENIIHVLNAPSPAATASISIGQSIAEKALKRFELGS